MGGPAADVGGVGGPVPGGDLLPLDRDLDVDAERLGQDGSGDLGGQGEQGGAAALPWADPDGVEPLGERVLGERASGPVPGEQPGGRDAEQAAPALSQRVEKSAEKIGCAVEVRHHEGSLADPPIAAACYENNQGLRPFLEETLATLAVWTEKNC